jgi:hypothetical protein
MQNGCQIKIVKNEDISKLACSSKQKEDRFCLPSSSLLSKFEVDKSVFGSGVLLSKGGQ